MGGGGIADCTAHTGVNYWAVDMNAYDRDDCWEPLRAARGGSTTFVPDGQAGGYGALLGIRHTAFSGGQTSTWYAHLNSPTSGAADSVFVQGDFIGKVGDTGNADFCHLHFQADSGHLGPPQGGQSLNIVLSGALFVNGYSLQGFSDDPEHAFASNNTGAGYCRPGAPGAQDPGSHDNTCEYEMRTYARNALVYGLDIGSTRASSRGACGANRFWIKRCSAGSYGTIIVQNFVSRGVFGEIPRALVASGNEAVMVDGHFWKTWGRRCSLGGQTRFVYEWLGQPTTEDLTLDVSTDIQYFQGGNIIRNYANPSNVTMYMQVNGVGQCTFAGVLDSNNDPCYDFDGTANVNSGDQLALAIHGYMNESNPSFNDKFDVNKGGTGWGAVNSGDQLFLSFQIGSSMQCK